MRMAKAGPHQWSVEDFLAFEAEESERYEFVDGVVRMMTGGSAAHSAIKGNVFAELRAALRGGGCRVDVDDLKVVTGTAVMYPDVLVICRLNISLWSYLHLTFVLIFQPYH
jgi:Uma2 family endonuclease